MKLNGSCHKEQNRERKLSPLVGESVSEADERGKLEQKRKNENQWNKNRYDIKI